MMIFQGEVMNRARTARGAKSKVSRSRSKKVTLPSDNLTPAQLRRKNGPVRTYRFDPAMTDDELATWPEDIREMYRERFGR